MSARTPKFISFRTGKYFLQSYTENLPRFPSPLWISAADATTIGVRIRPGEKGIENPYGNMFNACQTDSPARVEGLFYRGKPRWALSGREFRKDVLTAAGPNIWLTDSQIEALGLALNADAAKSETTFQVKDMSLKCYPLCSIANYERCVKALNMDHVCAVDGLPYATSRERTPLVRAVLERKYTSGIWVPTSAMSLFKASAKHNEEPVHVELYAEGGGDEYFLYNIEQLEDPAGVLRHMGLKRADEQISAKSGLALPQEIAAQLREAAGKQVGWSRYWMSEQGAFQRKPVGAERPRCTPAKGKNADWTFWVNATQLGESLLKSVVSKHMAAAQAKMVGQGGQAMP